MPFCSFFLKEKGTEKELWRKAPLCFFQTLNGFMACKGAKRGFAPKIFAEGFLVLHPGKICTDSAPSERGPYMKQIKPPV